MSWPYPRPGAKPGNAGREWPNEILSPYEVDLVLQAKKKSHTDSEQRDRAMVMLMYRAMLRVSQVSNLKRTEYDRARRQLKLGSDRKREIVSLDAETAAALDAWIDERKRLKIQSSHMFCVVKKDATQGSKPGKPLHTSNVRSLVISRGKRAGIDRRVNPEALRQSGKQHQPGPGSLSAGELHPAIAAAAAQVVSDGHYDSAVRAGAIALQDVIRDSSGLDLDGVALMRAALDLEDEPPIIVLADLSTRDGRGEQIGWYSLARGCVSALRNPVAHNEIFYTRLTAMEALATMSQVARRVESATR